MKKKLLLGTAAVCMSAALLAGCGADFNALGEAESPVNLTYSERTEGFYGILSGAEAFAARFSAGTYGGELEGNYACSPVSVYMALALAAECAGGGTRAELVSALGVPYETLKSDFSLFYRSVAEEQRSNGGDLRTLAAPVNSVWIDKSIEAKEDCVAALAQDYYCSSYSVDFRNANKAANQAVRDYVKKNTRGLIDRDFALDEKTVFTLVNALYLKEVWNDYGDELPLSGEEYSFRSSEGGVKRTRLLEKHHVVGKVYEGEVFRSFYAETSSSYRLKFLLPKAGYTVRDVFTAENLETVARLTYNGVDRENKICYNTRCFFPEFEAGYDGEVAPVLQAMGVTSMLDLSVSDFSSFTQARAYAAGVHHVSELKVNRRGIEGAAVTVIPMAGAAEPEPFEYVYEDFVVDGAFGFVLTNAYGTTLFSGVVNDIA